MGMFHWSHRFGVRLRALVLSCVCLCVLTGCAGPDFSMFESELTFGDAQISDTQTTYVMRIPDNGLGDLIGPAQLQWVIDTYGDTHGHTGVTAVTTKTQAKSLLIQSPALQCEALKHTYQEESPDEGPWVYADASCSKQRKLSWLEKTLWNMYSKQSEETIEWLSTSRNTLVAANGTVDTLKANANADYDDVFRPVNRYLRVAQGVLVVVAAMSLCVLAARIVWNIADGGAGRVLDRLGWILLGVLASSSSVSIALTFFSRAGTDGTPALQSWTPSGAFASGGFAYYLSDWVRMQVDPFLIVAAVVGVMAAGWKLVTQQEGRDLVSTGKAFLWAMLTSVCLAGMVNTFQSTFDAWTARVLRSASDMMADAWAANTLAAAQFFDLGAPLAIVLTIVMWFCGLIAKVFCYLRAGLLPIMVGVAPMWAAMSWMETGRQAFAKTLGWLAAFLLYKPVAALVMASGCAIMVTADAGDDSQAITLMLTLSVIILLPAMIRLIVPAVQSSVGGGGGIMPTILGGVGAGAIGLAGGGLRKAADMAGGLRPKPSTGSGGDVSPDGAKPGAGGWLSNALSGLTGHNGGHNGHAGGTGTGDTSAPGVGETGAASMSDAPQGADSSGVSPSVGSDATGSGSGSSADSGTGVDTNAHGVGGQFDSSPQGAGHGSQSPDTAAHTGATSSPDGAGRGPGVDAGAPDGVDRNTTRKGKLF